MAIGTNTNDTLSTTADFEFASGLDGNDSITSAHNFGFLNGGRGNDTLTTTYASTGTQTSVTQVGGNGNDSLTFIQSGPNNSGTSNLIALLDGGLNDDTITVDAPSISNGATTASLQASGGFGADTFDVEVQANSNVSADTDFVLDAGIGNDVITQAIAVAQTFGAATTAANVDQRVDLGNGNDTATGIDADSRSKGASTINQDILGQAGNDAIVGTVFTSSSALNTGGSSAITQVIDGGTGDDSIDARILGNFETLDSITGSSSVTGGNGADTITSTFLVDVLDTFDVDGFFEGGAGNDSISLNHDLSAVPALGLVQLDNMVDLGGSNDTLSATIDIVDVLIAVNNNTVTSAQGFNVVNLAANSTAGSFGVINNNITTGGNADQITASANAAMRQDGTVAATDFTDGRNIIASGGGNDTIDATATALSSGAQLNPTFPWSGIALNSIDAGGGADSIDSTVNTSAEVAGTGVARADQNIQGGTGKDTITATIDSAGLELATLDHINNISGGAANDVITSTVGLTATTSITYAGIILGDTGSDVIDSTVTISSSSNPLNTVNETILAGAGLDTVMATLDTSGTPVRGSATITIDGGAGTDTILATAIGDFGAFNIDGGDANDVISITNTVFNATRDTLKGGAGNDTITGGDGLESIAGDAGADHLVASLFGSEFHGGSIAGTGDGEADTFVFAPTVQQGSNTIHDFEFAHDILQFTGLVDAGAPGLADDIDALIVDSADFGAGSDRYIVLSSGTYIQFNDTGTGSFTSIADMVSDPLSQLIA